MERKTRQIRARIHRRAEIHSRTLNNERPQRDVEGSRPLLCGRREAAGGRWWQLIMEKSRGVKLREL